MAPVMDNRELKQMPIDELWALHEEVRAVLTARIAAEKRVLEERLDQLDNQANASQRRRPYPPVKPKFRNPGNPAETWSGRGRRPRWVVEQLRSGKRMEDLQIQGAE
jgi:DNA-binding protein H-NS